MFLFYLKERTQYVQYLSLSEITNLSNKSPTRSCMEKNKNTRLLISFFFTIIICTSVLPSSVYGVNKSEFDPNNSTILPGYLNCLINYTTSQCKECPPNCITFWSDSFIISNKDLAPELDKIFEKSLRQISIIESSDVQTNHTKTAIIYLQSLLLKNEINLEELKLITNIFNEINKTNSTTTLGKNLHAKLQEFLINEKTSPISISIVSILAKSVDLLINSDSIISKISEYPNLSHDLREQKAWLNNNLANTIVGCEIAEVLGCLLASIMSSGII